VTPSTPAAPEVAGGVTEETNGNDENKAIEDALKKETSGEKETLVDDLNAEIDGDEEEESHFEHLKEGTESGNLPQRSRNAGTAPKNDLSLDKEGDEVRTEDLENTNHGSKEPQYDYSVMDELLDFFDQETIEPILCGYFNKVIQSLVTKASSKAKVLSYLLIHRKGDVFDLLLKHMQHHSLAQLMVELMQIKITGSQSSAMGSSARGRVSSDFDNKTDDGEESKDEKEGKDNLTPQEQAMLDILNLKR
jgi:hypothetical protein